MCRLHRRPLTAALHFDLIQAGPVGNSNLDLLVCEHRVPPQEARCIPALVHTRRGSIGDDRNAISQLVSASSPSMHIAAIIIACPASEGLVSQLAAAVLLIPL